MGTRAQLLREGVLEKRKGALVGWERKHEWFRTIQKTTEWRDKWVKETSGSGRSHCRSHSHNHRVAVGHTIPREDGWKLRRECVLQLPSRLSSAHTRMTLWSRVWMSVGRDVSLRLPLKGRPCVNSGEVCAMGPIVLPPFDLRHCLYEPSHGAHKLFASHNFSWCNVNRINRPALKGSSLGSNSKRN